MKQLYMVILLGISVFANNFDKAVEDYNQGAYIKAMDAFLVLAKKGDDKAQFNIAMMYAEGKGVKINIVEATHWYEKSAKQKNAQAAYNLAKIYYAKGERDSHAYIKAKYWYERALEGNIKEAYNNLASIYLEGKGVQKNIQKAFKLFKKAADLGDSMAQVNVGLLYAWGEDISHNKMKAYENFKKALNAGKSQASEYLDKLCEESAWVCKD